MIYLLHGRYKTWQNSLTNKLWSKTRAFLRLSNSQTLSLWVLGQTETIITKVSSFLDNFSYNTAIINLALNHDSFLCISLDYVVFLPMKLNELQSYFKRYLLHYSVYNCWFICKPIYLTSYLSHIKMIETTYELDFPFNVRDNLLHLDIY